MLLLYMAANWLGPVLRNCFVLELMVLNHLRLSCLFSERMRTGLSVAGWNVELVAELRSHNRWHSQQPVPKRDHRDNNGAVDQRHHHQL